MSGGSWDYVYMKFEDVAGSLSHSDMPERRALGDLIARVAKAMHAIEWVDSCDLGSGDEVDQIRAALGLHADAAILAEAIKAAEIERLHLDKAIAKARTVFDKSAQ